MDRSELPNECSPPWIVFPQIQPAELSGYLKQGETEAWFDQHWRPFWNRLTSEQRTQYLDYWQASSAWREALAFFFDADEDFDLEADARESEAFLEKWRKSQRKL